MKKLKPVSAKEQLVKPAENEARVLDVFLHLPASCLFLPETLMCRLRVKCSRAHIWSGMFKTLGCKPFSRPSPWKIKSHLCAFHSGSCVARCRPTFLVLWTFPLKVLVHSSWITCLYLNMLLVWLRLLVLFYSYLECLLQALGLKTLVSKTYKIRINRMQYRHTTLVHESCFLSVLLRNLFLCFRCHSAYLS